MFEGGPGPDLAAALAEADVATLTDDGVVDTMTGWERVSRWAAAMSLAAVDELEQRRPGRDAEFVQDEIALALRISRMAAGSRLLLASQLRRLPGVREALQAGELDMTKARIVADAVQPLDDAAATRVEQRILPRAAEQTPGQLRAACERAVVHADPAAAARRHDHALRDRGVRLIALGDGMAELSLRHTADRITALYNAIDTLARHARSATDDLVIASVTVAVTTGRGVGYAHPGSAARRRHGRPGGACPRRCPSLAHRTHRVTELSRRAGRVRPADATASRTAARAAARRPRARGHPCGHAPRRHRSTGRAARVRPDPCRSCSTHRRRRHLAAHLHRSGHRSPDACRPRCLHSAALGGRARAHS